VKRLLRALFRRALRIFFRRVEIEGAERVPGSGPVIFIANHPNALVDPLLLLCFSPRPVSFLAKAPLFRMPLVGSFVRALGSIPVYRQQDPGTDLAKNRETFESARRLLAGGGSLALFPEGASHDEPKLLPMKTGGARIALGAAGRAGVALSVVPASLYYTWKQRFRSSVLLTFGERIEVDPVALDEEGEPPRQAVRKLTERLGEALEGLALQAETHDALNLVRRAERIFSVDEPDRKDLTLAEELSRRRRFVEGHWRLTQRDPARLAKLEDRIALFEAERRAAGLSLDHLTPEGLGARGVLRLLLRNLGALFLLPFAAIGVVLHYPIYRFVGWLSRSIARREEDVLATVKVGASILLFPALWLAGTLLAARFLGPWGAVAALVGLPFSGWAALRVAESLEEISGRARALGHLFVSNYAVKRLLAERRRIREGMVQAGDWLDSQAAGETPAPADKP
jgi:glycerol-3-phosphate O-acyltransferase/dihydroxyacetone phosphate acyltransferase